jgi:hypothetical protein
MTRDLTTGMASEVTNPFTTPAYFVEVQFSSPVRFSSRGTLDWNGNTWESRSISVRGLAFELGAAQQSGSLAILDADLSLTTLIHLEGIKGRSINVWKFYGTAPADDDPIKLFAGAGDTATMDERSGSATIALVQRSARELFCPRRFQTRSLGFGLLPVAGSIFTWGGENFKLERDRG